MSHISWDVCACLPMLTDLQENCRGSHRGASVAVGMVRLLKALETVGDMIPTHILGSMHLGTPGCRSEWLPSLGQLWVDPKC